MYKKIAVTAALFALVAGLTACSDAGGGEADGAKGATVCYITAADSHVYATPANEALQAKADAAGVEILKLSQEFDAQKGTDQLNTCISRGVQGIILWPLDPQVYLAGLTAAKEAGIPVVLINSPMDDEGLKLVESFTGPDNYEEGGLMAEALNDALGGEGNVVIIEGQPGNGTTISRTTGFTDKLAELGSKIEVIATVSSDFDTQKALEASRDVITRFGDQIDAVYGDDASAPGFVQAWKESGQSGPIPLVTGINGQKDVFDAIKAGDIFATILQSPKLDGELAFDTMKDILDGKKVEKRIPIELTVVTADNVDSLEPAF